MFSKIVLLFAFMASIDAKSTKTPSSKPVKSVKPVLKPSFKPTAPKPTAKPTVYTKTIYSKDYPTLDSFVPIDGSSGMYT